MVFRKENEPKEPLTPMDLDYMRILKFCLYILGGWPFAELYQAYHEKPRHLPLRHFKTLFVFWFIILLSGTTYLTTHMGKLEFIILGHTYITVFMNVIAMQRVQMPYLKSFRNTVSEFVLKIHLFHHKQRSKYATEVSAQVDKISKFFTICLYTQVLIGVIFFNLTPIYRNIQSGVFETSDHSPDNGTQYELSIYLYTPFEYNNFGYILISLFNLLLAFDCASCFCTYDVLMSIIIFHIWGHLKILKHNLENFSMPTNEILNMNEASKYITEEESREVFTWLKKQIEHHKLITEFIKLASDGLGLMMCFYYSFHQVAGCILLLEVSALNPEALAIYGILTFVIFQQLIQISIVFELVGSKSETIKDAVYSLPWECMDVKNRKIVLFFLCNTQRPITLKAMGMVSVGVKTAAACGLLALTVSISALIAPYRFTCFLLLIIIKTSISYFIMLRTFAEG